MPNTFTADFVELIAEVSAGLKREPHRLKELRDGMVKRGMHTESGWAELIKQIDDGAPVGEICRRLDGSIATMRRINAGIDPIPPASAAEAQRSDGPRS